MKTMLKAIALLVTAAMVTTAQAADFEPTEDQTIHSVFGTDDGAAGAMVIKGGTPYDGGTGGILYGWPGETFGGATTNAFLKNSPRNAVSGAFTVHQMITSWDESTDWGTSQPVAGVDYNPHPIGMLGNNDPSNTAGRPDSTEISHIVDYWANGGTNNGLYLKPLGTLNNANFVGNGNREFQYLSRHAVAGLDGDDTRISTNNGAHSYIGNYIEPISDAIINEGAKDANLNNAQAIWGSGVSNDNRLIPLLKWGLGEVSIANPTMATQHTVGAAHIKVQSANGDTTQFNVHRMLTAWDEHSVSWNQFGAAGPQSGSDYVAASLGVIDVDNSNLATELDITSTVNFWLANPDQNHGVILVPVVTSGSQETPIIDAIRVWGLDGGAPGDDTWLRFSGVQIPEPSTMVLGAMGMLAMLKRRRNA